MAPRLVVVVVCVCVVDIGVGLIANPISPMADDDATPPAPAGTAITRLILGVTDY